MSSTRADEMIAILRAVAAGTMTPPEIADDSNHPQSKKKGNNVVASRRHITKTANEGQGWLREWEDRHGQW